MRPCRRRLIDLAELADLPKHACIVKRAADFGDELCVRVGRTALAVCAGVLGYAQTAIDVGGVLCLVNGSIMRIICRGDVGGNAGGLGEHVARLFALCLREVSDEVTHVLGVEARVAVAAGLFLIGEHSDDGLHRVLAVEDSFKCRVCANAVIVAVSADEAAVKADIHRLERRDELDLCGDEVASTMPYFSFKRRMMFSLYASLASSSRTGRLPMRMLRSSPVKAVPSGFVA